MRKLIICPVCKTEQHIYKGNICKHQGESILTCAGSGLLVSSFTGLVIGEAKPWKK